MRLFCRLMLLWVMGMSMSMGAREAVGQEVADGPTEAQRDALRRMVLEIKALNERQEPVAVDPASAVAAGRYYSLFERMPEAVKEDARAVVMKADRLRVQEDWSSKPDAARLAVELEKAQEWIEELVAAAGLERGELRMAGSLRDRPLEKGDPRFGFLGDLRTATSILRADAIRLWSTGERAKAMTRVGACLGVLRHLNQEKVGWVTTLVAQHELQWLRELIEAFEVTEGGGQTLTSTRRFVEAVKALDVADPVRVRAGWRASSTWWIDFVDQESSHGVISDKLLMEFGESRVMRDAFAAIFERATEGKKQSVPTVARAELVKNMMTELGNLSVEDIRKELAKARAGFKAIDAAWGGNEEVLAEALSVMDEHDHGVLMMCLLTPEPMHTKWAASVKDVKMLRKAAGLGEGIAGNEERAAESR